METSHENPDMSKEVLPENALERSNERPFEHTKIPVVQGYEGFRDFQELYPGYTFTPYLADKDEAGWDASTSRVYMNQVLPNFLYVPVNIQGGDTAGLTEFFDAASADPTVAAINITQPHKSNPVLMDKFASGTGAPRNVDTLIRDEQGNLAPRDLNALAFIEWYQETIGSFAGHSVVLVGVGGVGEPTARHISKLEPSELWLVDPGDKTALAEELNLDAPTRYVASILDAHPDSTKPVIAINAAGKEAGTDGNLVEWLEKEQVQEDRVFVDLRPHLDIPEVKAAANLGWKADTGHGMNARNDYVMVTEIARAMNIIPPDFATFEQLVAAAS